MSGVMSVTRRAGLAAALSAALLCAGQLIPAVAAADPEPAPQPPIPTQATDPAAAPGLLHNITFKARADGTSRGATVAYKADDHNINSEQPTLLPGQTFEINTVMSDPKLAGMELTIQWPYGSNLHCEILVDDQTVAQADQFIAPRVFRVKDDPLYGTLQCGAPLDVPAAGQVPAPAPTTVPAPPE